MECHSEQTMINFRIHCQSNHFDQISQSYTLYQNAAIKMLLRNNPCQLLIIIQTYMFWFAGSSVVESQPVTRVVWVPIPTSKAGFRQITIVKRPQGHWVGYSTPKNAIAPRNRQKSSTLLLSSLCNCAREKKLKVMLNSL